MKVNPSKRLTVSLSLYKYCVTHSVFPAIYGLSIYLGEALNKINRILSVKFLSISLVLTFFWLDLIVPMPVESYNKVVFILSQPQRVIFFKGCLRNRNVKGPIYKEPFFVASNGSQANVPNTLRIVDTLRTIFHETQCNIKIVSFERCYFEYQWSLLWMKACKK